MLKHSVATRTHHTLFFFFFNDTATTEIYTLSLHDALPICIRSGVNWMRENRRSSASATVWTIRVFASPGTPRSSARSEEHTSELQSQSNLVCRLLLEKKKNDRRERRSASRQHASHVVCKLH